MSSASPWLDTIRTSLNVGHTPCASLAPPHIVAFVGNAPLPNDDSDAGRATDDNDVPAKAFASIVATELPNTTDLKLDTPSNALAPTRVSESGRTNVSSAVPWNARVPMLSTELPNLTAARLDAPSAA
jgi:hypothetical protein